MTQSNFAEQQRKKHRHIQQCKATAERVADLEALLDIAKALRSHGCRILHFLSTDTGAQIWVEPDDVFKRFILGRVVTIDNRYRSEKVTQVECHVKHLGVQIKWVEL